MSAIPNHLFSKHERKLTAEASTLEANGAACWRSDMRIQGNAGIAEFELFSQKRDSEGDVQYWRFTPTRETVRTFPKLEGWSVIVFND